MRKGKKKVKKKEVKNPRMMNNITEERFVELQTQAYYNAMKKLEEDKNVVREVKVDKTSFLHDIGFMFLLILWPKKAKEKYDLRDDITNGVFSMISSIIMWLLGNGIKFLAAIILVVDVCGIITKFINVYFFVTFLLLDIFMAMIGSLFVLSSDEIAKERNSGVIMTYTSNILAVVSIMVAIVAIVVSV